MRNWITTVEDATDTQSDELMAAVEAVYNYIMHTIPADHYHIADVLHRHGYVEPKTGNSFFRAITKTEFKLGGAQSGCDTFNDAADFAKWVNREFQLRDQWYVFELYAKGNAILWSAEGLTRFYQNNEDTLPDEVIRMLDEVYELYGHQNEIMIDTNKCSVVRIKPVK